MPREGERGSPWDMTGDVRPYPSGGGMTQAIPTPDWGAYGLMECAVKG